MSFLFFFNDTATTEIYTLSLHDALPILIKSGVVASIMYKGQNFGAEGAFLLRWDHLTLKPEIGRAHV